MRVTLAVFGPERRRWIARRPIVGDQLAPGRDPFRCPTKPAGNHRTPWPYSRPDVAKRNASRAMLVHNHPSGDPTPSHADIEMTKEVAKVAKTLGIGKDGHASLKGMKLI